MMPAELPRLCAEADSAVSSFISWFLLWRRKRIAPVIKAATAANMPITRPAIAPLLRLPLDLFPASAIVVTVSIMTVPALVTVCTEVIVVCRALPLLSLLVVVLAVA